MKNYKKIIIEILKENYKIIYNKNFQWRQHANFIHKQQELINCLLDSDKKFKSEGKLWFKFIYSNLFMAKNSQQASNCVSGSFNINVKQG